MFLHVGPRLVLVQAVPTLRSIFVRVAFENEHGISTVPLQRR